MTRLRYNGLSTTLGASLTSSATAVTFAAALTHSGGTAVPTIGAGDSIPLSILDSMGKLSEVVYLTAYTSGATTGTITRGQEGTTGVSHASGDKVTHGPTAQDVTGLSPAIRGRTSGYSASGASFAFTVPATAQAGDLLVAFIGTNSDVPTPPAGWTLSASSLASFHAAFILTRICQPGDPGTTVTVTVAGGEQADWYCLAFADATRIHYSGAVQAGNTTIRLAAGSSVGGSPVHTVVVFGSSRVGSGTVAMPGATVIEARADAGSRSALFTFSPELPRPLILTGSVAGSGMGLAWVEVAS